MLVVTYPNSLKDLYRFKPYKYLRNITNTRNKIGATLKYQHKNHHMDRYLLWYQLPIYQKMNEICNSLDKRTVARAIRLGMDERPDIGTRCISLTYVL